MLICSFSISYKYPWTIGAAYPTTVPHSQSHAAGSPAHLDPTCQSHSTYPALCNGVPSGGTMGDLGWQHSCRRVGAARPRPYPGRTHPRRSAKSWLVVFSVLRGNQGFWGLCFFAFLLRSDHIYSMRLRSNDFSCSQIFESPFSNFCLVHCCSKNVGLCWCFWAQL